jgi:hypothetical protein
MENAVERIFWFSRRFRALMRSSPPQFSTTATKGFVAFACHAAQGLGYGVFACRR